MKACANIMRNWPAKTVPAAALRQKVLDMQILPLSDSAILLRLGESIEPTINRQVHLLAAALTLNPLPGLLETVPGYASLSIHYNPLALTHAQVCDWLESHINLATESASRPVKTVEVPVIYDGPDLDFVAAHCRLTVDEVIRLHTQTIYTVYMMGFTPGFPYLGSLPEALRVPRMETPRPKVPAGSVALAGVQTGIYPVESPGGWRLVGRTLLTLFDPMREPPFLFTPGDKVQFVPL